VIARVVGLLIALASMVATADPAALAEAHWKGCASCHGEAGQGLRPKEAPGIAGQDAAYLERQMRAFQSGIRGRHPDDASGSRMALMAAAIRDDDVLAALARRVAAMPPPAAPATLRSDAERGRQLYGTCAVCHGAAGQGSAAAPRLAGIGDWYLLAQLRKYRDGVRGSVQGDAAGQGMAALVAGLNDAELASLAVYAHSLAAPP